MRTTLATLFGAAALAGALSLQAAEPGDRAERFRGHRMHDCSQAADPKACEERRDRMRQAMRDARAACEAKETRAEHRQCMAEQICAKAPDPAQCQARMKERAEMRGRMLEACRGKEGDELRSCMREQRRQLHRDHRDRAPATS